MTGERLQQLAGDVLAAADEVKQIREQRDIAQTECRKLDAKLQEAQKRLEVARWELIEHSEGGDPA